MHVGKLTANRKQPFCIPRSLSSFSCHLSHQRVFFCILCIFHSVFFFFIVHLSYSTAASSAYLTIINLVPTQTEQNYSWPRQRGKSMCVKIKYFSHTLILCILWYGYYGNLYVVSKPGLPHVRKKRLKKNCLINVSVNQSINQSRHYISWPSLQKVFAFKFVLNILHFHLPQRLKTIYENNNDFQWVGWSFFSFNCAAVSGYGFRYACMYVCMHMCM